MKLVAKHNRRALAAAKAYAADKPWRGTFLDRVAKIRSFHADLCEAYGINTDLIIDVNGDLPDNAGGFVTYDGPIGGAIVLKPGFAVMTYLHLFAEALTYARELKWVENYDGVADYSAAWANSLFKKAFPRSFQKLVDRNAPILTRNYVA